MTSFFGKMRLSNQFKTAFGAIFILCLLQGCLTLLVLANQEQRMKATFNNGADPAMQTSDSSKQQIGSAAMQIADPNWILRCLAVSIIVLTSLLCLGIGWYLTRLIVPPILAATEALQRVAENDLTVSVAVRSENEIGRLSVSVNSSVAAMRSVLRSVVRSAGSFTAAAQELNIRSAESSDNTREQSGKTSQIATAAQQMKLVISEISENTEAVSVLSRESSEAAEQGGAVMQSASEAMEKIATITGTVADKITSLALRSEEIGKVVRLIQEISEQTNLLALNAAIEAARAGEHGRGFAVVAGEVRRLAERTTTATQEIAQTIHSIQDETHATLELMQGNREAVDSGLSETTRAGRRLTTIANSSRQVEQMIMMISLATSQETSASNEIAQSAKEIFQLSSSNSQAAEKAAEACKSLSCLANDLDTIIRKFRIDQAVGGENDTGETPIRQAVSIATPLPA